MSVALFYIAAYLPRAAASFHHAVVYRLVTRVERKPVHNDDGAD